MKTGRGTNTLKLTGFLVLVSLAISTRAQVPGVEWVKGSGGAPGESALGSAVATDLNGNVYTTGTFGGTIDFDPGSGVHSVTSAGEQSGFILKLDADGNFQWVKQMGLWGTSLTIDPAGNVYVTGHFYDDGNFGSIPLTSNGDTEIFICKLDENGDFIWANAIGSNEYDYGNAITLDSFGDLYVTGTYTNTVSFGSTILTSKDNTEDIFVTKLDQDGNFIWAKSMGGGDTDYASAITTRSGNVYITGSFSQPADDDVDFDPGSGIADLNAQGTDIFIVTLTDEGDLVWAKQMGGPGYEVAMSIATDASGNIYTTGSFGGTADFDPDATNAFELTSVSTTSDIFISKLDEDGNYSWAKSFSGNDEDATGTGYSIRIGTTGDVYTAGNFYGTVDFDPDPTATFHLTAISDNSYISRLSAEGELIWAGGNDDQEFNKTNSISLDDSGTLYATGTFSGTDVDLGPDDCESNLTSTGNNDLFITKTGTAPSSCVEIVITVHPISQTVCVGAIVTFEVAATGASNITFQWQIEVDDGDGGLYWDNISDGGDFAGTNTNILTITTAGNFGEGNYRCVVSGDLASDEISEEANLDIGPDMPVVLGSDIVHCGPGSVAITAFGGVSGQYRWYTQATGGLPIAGEFNSTYTTPVLTSNTMYYVAINNGTCESARNSVQVAISTCEAQPGFVWAQGWGSGDMSNGTNEGSSILIDGDGNLLVSGTFQGTIDFDNGPGTAILTAVQYDAYLMKLTPAGSLLWVKSFGGPLLDYGGQISLDAAGNIYLMSSFTGTADFDPGTPVVPLTVTTGSPAGEADGAISKFDKNGNFIWVRQIGGRLDEYMSGLKADAAGNVYVAGSFRQATGGTSFGGTFTLTALGAGSTDIFFAKLNTSGTFLWAGNIGANIATGTNFLSDAGIAIDIDAAGNAYISGRISGPATVDFDPGAGVVNQNTTIDGAAFLLKLNSAGVYQNHYLIEKASGNAVRVDASNNVYITGAFSGTVDLDPGAGVFNATGDGANYITKLNSSGNFVWGKVFAPDFGSASVLFYDIAFDGSGNLYSTGYYTATTDFDPGPLVESHSINGMFILNTFTLKLGTDGDFKWVSTPRAMGSSANVSPGGIAVSAAGDVYLTGRYARRVDLDPGSCVFELNNVNGGNVYVSKLSPALPNICFDIHPASVSVCDNAMVTFTTVVTSANPVLYQWQKLNAATSLYEDISNTGGYSGVATSVLTVNTTGNFGAGEYRAKIYSDRTVNAFSNSASLSLGGGITAPTTTGNARCTPGPVSLTASGGSNGQYRWYDVAMGGTALAGETSSTFTTPSLSITTSYYVSIINGCESARTVATATISALPAAPGATPASRCGTGTVILTASGGSNGQYRWYDVAAGGTAKAGETNSTFTTPSISSTTSYYVAISNGTCESARTQVIAMVGGSACVGNIAPVITGAPIATQIEGNVTVNLTPWLSDPDNNLDLSTLRIITSPASGARASIDANHNLILDYKGISFSGVDRLTIEVCDLSGACSQKEVLIEVAGDITVYNGISPNGDQLNDVLILKNIEVLNETKSNHVFIYNRWGDLLFDVADYDNKNKVFRGLNNNGNEIPSGTYFYKINFTSGIETQSGFLYLKR